MITGMSAPPIGRVAVAPTTRPTATSAQSQAHSPGCAVTRTTSTTPAVMPAALKIWMPPNPAPLTDSRSLAKATRDPVKVTAPMSAVRAAATASWLSARPRSTASMNEAEATSTEAPPPKPLNSATSSGMEVIWSRRARAVPMSPPRARPATRTP